MNVFNRIRETVSHGLHRFINNNHGFRAGFGPVLETLLGITIVLGIGAFSGQPWGWLNLQPHPLWIVVLAIAVRYGGRNG